MDLDEYLWRTKTTAVDLAKKIDCCPNTICKIKSKECSAGVLIATKIISVSKEKINLEELMSNRDKDKFKKWMQSMSENDIK